MPSKTIQLDEPALEGQTLTLRMYDGTTLVQNTLATTTATTGRFTWTISAAVTAKEYQVRVYIGSFMAGTYYVYFEDGDVEGTYRVYNFSRAEIVEPSRVGLATTADIEAIGMFPGAGTAYRSRFIGSYLPGHAFTNNRFVSRTGLDLSETGFTVVLWRNDDPTSAVNVTIVSAGVTSTVLPYTHTLGNNFVNGDRGSFVLLKDNVVVAVQHFTVSSDLEQTKVFAKIASQNNQV